MTGTSIVEMSSVKIRRNGWWNILAIRRKAPSSVFRNATKVNKAGMTGPSMLTRRGKSMLSVM